MPNPIVQAGLSAVQASPRRLHAAAALAAMLALLAYHAVTGFPTLADSGGDNDSVMRLVQVRDLLAGQGWFDTHQYRMGVEGGFPMHWSRLVDAPIALLAALFGEAAALVVWPAALFGVSAYLIIRMAYRLGGEWAVLPAAAVGGLALWFVNAYPPGAIDHHNVQLTLALATIHLLMRSRDDARAAALAGATAALMLAVGMEAAPYVAVACAVAATAFLLRGEDEAAVARGFGAAFALVALAALAATVAPQDWLAVHCDAHSLPQAALAAAGGGGLWLAASVPALRRSLAGRLAALAGLGAVAAGLVLFAFPQCLAAPYSDLDPRVYDFLIENITEAQSLFSILGSAPAMAAGYYVTPLIGLAALVWGMRRRGVSRDALILAAFLAMAIAVSVWQVRGSVFAIAIAAVPLAAWIAAARRRADADASVPAQLAMLGAWLVSFNLVWNQVPTLFSAAAATPAGSEADASACYAHADYALLAGLPAGTVLAISNQGASILLDTPHRALNGPYHRNNAGNLAALDMLMSGAAEAKTAARRHGVDYVALCPGNDETAALRAWAPDGFMAGLADGDVPDWLSPVPESDGAAIRIYRVLESDTSGL